MITTSSNFSEVISFLESNKPQLKSNSAKVEIQWAKLERQSKGKNTSMLHKYDIEGVTCWHIRHGNGQMFHYGNYVVVPFAKDKYQFIEWTAQGKHPFKYTSHFFDRYKERMNIKGGIKQCVKQFSKHSVSMVCIYRKNGQFVFCMDDGLVLGVEDELLQMSVCCTFVSYDLLKDSQRTAFNKVKDVVDEIRSAHIQLHKQGVSFTDSTKLIEEKFKSVYESAAEIYAWYFETGELKLRN